MARAPRASAAFPLAAWVATLVLGGSAGLSAQILSLPPRPANAPGGEALARELRSLDLPGREERILEEIARGNVPGWLRALRPVAVEGDAGGRIRRATFWVTPDYLAVGADDDFFRVPLSPQAAQRVAELVGALLPTPRMVDAVWAAAEVRLDPIPIAPGPEMTTVPVFEEHHRLVEAQWSLGGHARGGLTAGHKKDVVVSARLASSPGKVAIYGWHRLDGTPIQPLYTGHTDAWVDYSHGIRLVLRHVTVDGEGHDLAEALASAEMAPLFSAEGVVAEPRYPARRGSDPGQR